MPQLKFTAVGIPKAQPRAKAFARNGHAGVYDPGTANDWKTIVRNAARESWSGEQFSGPVSVTLEVWMPRPKNHFNSVGLLKRTAPYWVEKKPDLDNIEKAILDALTNLGIWRDDSQVVEVYKSKRYGVPRALVTVNDAATVFLELD